MLQLLGARVDSNDPSRMRVFWLTLRPLQPSMLASMRPTVRCSILLGGIVMSTFQSCSTLCGPLTPILDMLDQCHAAVAAFWELTGCPLPRCGFSLISHVLSLSRHPSSRRTSKKRPERECDSTLEDQVGRSARAP
jgi:hypothetical protein